MLKKCVSGILAGIAVSLGGCAYLACENRYVGALLFCAALYCICSRSYALFTGKICFIPECHCREDMSLLLLCLLGNAAAAIAVGFLSAFAVPSLGDTALKICSAKLTMTLPQALVRGAFCGMLIYLPVSIYKERQSSLAIFLCIPCFILSGFEHCIADMYYFAASGIVSGQAFIFIMTVLVGNCLGGMLLPCLEALTKEKAK